MNKDTLILFCGCAYSDVIDAETKRKVLGALEASELRFRIVSDLCRAAAFERDFLIKLAEENTLKVVGCFERSIKWLLEWAGVDSGGIEFFNMKTNSAEDIISSLIGRDVKSRAEAVVANPTDWMPWFPVIDEDRCINCKQCLNFCLFGVYSLVEGKVTVTDPKACKTNCPACAKVCPQTAIIFPKFDKSPINGDIVDDKNVTPVDLSSFMHGDLRKQLLNRSKHKRFAPETNSQINLSDLKRFGDSLDVPQDVLDSLSKESDQNSSLCDNGSKKDNGIDKDKS